MFLIRRDYTPFMARCKYSKNSTGQNSREIMNFTSYITENDSVQATATLVHDLLKPRPHYVSLIHKPDIIGHETQYCRSNNITLEIIL